FRRFFNVNIVLLSGSKVGSKTRTAMGYVQKEIMNNYPELVVTAIDLADYDIQFSDGRLYMDYDGDTGYVAKTIMDADALIIGTPIFQASIPATLKNIFDLLPGDAFQDKVVSMLVTAGSPKHFLIPEQQIKPILSYMKAQIVHTYVFIEEKDFYQKKIVNDDVFFRMERLIEDTVLLAKAHQAIQAEREAKSDVRSCLASPQVSIHTHTGKLNTFTLIFPDLKFFLTTSRLHHSLDLK